MLRSVYLLRCRTCINLKEVVTCRKFINTVSNESFQSRALKYFKSATQLQKPWPHATEITDDYFENLLPKAQTTLKNVYSDFEKLELVESDVLRNRILYDIDIQCFSILHLLKPHEILNLLQKFLHNFPYHLPTSYFYHKAISYLVGALENRLLSDQDIIQFLFFMSVNKDIAHCYINDIRPFLPDIHKLTLFEKCLVAECFLKLQVTFTPNESREYERIIENEFELVKDDPNLLIILCKALASISTSEILTLKQLTNTIVCAREPWDFTILVNLLSLYSKALLFEPKVIDCLVKDGIEAMKNDLESDNLQLELNDISKFLKSLSNLGLTMSLDQKLILKTIVEKRYEEYKQIKNLSYFVNTILCLHMLRCWNSKLLIMCFRDKVFEPVYQYKYFWRVQSRLNLLVMEINLEMKLKTPKSLNRPVDLTFIPSTNVSELAVICRKLIESKNVISIKIECPIAALYIPGVTLYTAASTYHVDVLDNTTCLKDTNVPHGYMNLKLRLLTRLRMQKILVPKSMLKEPRDVENYILNKINYRRTSRFQYVW